MLVDLVYPHVHAYFLHSEICRLHRGLELVRKQYKKDSTDQPRPKTSARTAPPPLEFRSLLKLQVSQPNSGKIFYKTQKKYDTTSMEWHFKQQGRLRGQALTHSGGSGVAGEEVRNKQGARTCIVRRPPLEI
jgi:hypothetical protein